MYIIKIKNLFFTRGNKIIFENISLNIKLGKITAIMGPSGCGKTTLLRLIGGQLSQNSGEIIINEKNISNLNKTDLYKLRKNIGMLFQTGALFTDLNVYENIAFPIREHTNLPEKIIRDIVLIKLQSVGLREALNLMPSELSIGMAKRVALARTIALDPSIIMYDEPFSGQDPISMGILLKLIKSLNDSMNMTTIIVSHDVYETISISDYIYLIDNKKIISEGTSEDFKKNENKFVQHFINNKINYKKDPKYIKKKYKNDLFNYK
ncbi:MAG TPA: ATP-binding cassette domain-containing protein [Candidatus Azoamicus sp. OHIO1]